MNLQGLITSFDDLLASIAWFILVLPRSLWRILFRPRWIAALVREELLKPQADRFRESSPPVLLYSAVGALFGLVVMPYLYRLDTQALGLLLPPERLSSLAPPPTSTWLAGGEISALPIEKMLLLFGVTGLGALLVSTLIVRYLAALGKDYSSFRPLFLTQCYCWIGAYTFMCAAYGASVGWMLLGGALVEAPVAPGSLPWFILAVASFLTKLIQVVVALVWLAYAEAHVLRLERRQTQASIVLGGVVVVVSFMVAILVSMFVYPQLLDAILLTQWR